MTFKSYYFIIFLFSYFTANASHSNEKWVVITTIQYPTPAVQKIATLPGWRVVVVGDKKTPVDWMCNNCDFLSVEKQLELGFEITSLLPWNHYSRKNIGYLYAISQGAQVIYETDDDNEVIDSITDISELENIIELSSNRDFVNVYAYFGKPEVWPRGYPLTEITFSKDFFVKQLFSPLKIGVIQGLVDKDPDVDAIYRLTRGTEVYFSKKDPCIIPLKKFSPFNTQNTIFDYNAFWGLFIPSTTPFRVCDIWRSFITQRLLWDLEMVICFTSSTAIQERNAHDYFKDFCGELELYLDAKRLTDFLLEWKDLSTLNLEERYQHLIEALVEKEFIKSEEIQILRAWINDLKKVGYKFPACTRI